ncbi:LapA family protein [Pseudomonas sp. EA_65y_Pfl1_P113]|uniref:LapA family protein n=1 Tax=Pseudomonas sp. EA_65y_Pfl1_P113 TaxID=3088692 RepID=UPI0030D7C195
MSKVKQLIAVALLILVVAVVIIFTLENDQPVALGFLSWSTPQASVGVYIVLALLVGCCIGPVISWLAGMRHVAMSRLNR